MTRLNIIPDQSWGYIDKTGHFAIMPRFAGTSDFHNGLATVWTDDPLKFVQEIDRDGNLTGRVFSILDSRDRKAKFPRKQLIDYQWFYTDESGNKIIDVPFAEGSEFSEDGIAAVRREKGEPEETARPFELIDLTGNTLAILPEAIRSVDTWSEGLLAFSTTDDYANSSGYLDIHGNVVIPPQFRHADVFREGLAAVMIDRNWHLIDRTGARLVSFPESVSHCGHFEDGLAPAAAGGKAYKDQHDAPNRQARWGFVDRSGQFVIAAQFEIDQELFPPRFREGLARVCIEKDGILGVGFIDKTGTFVIEPKFKNAHDFSEGLAAVQLSSRVFVPEEWKSDPGGARYGRSEMAAKFFRQYKVIGMKRSQIHELLGAPEKAREVLNHATALTILDPECAQDNLSEPPNRDVYNLEQGTCSHSWLWLHVEYEDDRVHRYRVSGINMSGEWVYDGGPPYVSESDGRSI